MKNSTYWSYNLPLQAFPDRVDEDDEKSPITDYRVLNYMPRKEACRTMQLSELLEDSGQSKEEYFEAAAAHLEHLAQMFRKLAKGEIDTIYYHDEDMDKTQLP